MQDAFAHCEALVRAADRDRFLSALFAPADRRGAILALYAFNTEITRIREAIRDPVAGEIRLQWWNDALDGRGHGDVEANPVAAALTTTVTRFGLSVARLKSLIEARRFDLYEEPMATLADLEVYAEGAAAGLIALTAQVLSSGQPPRMDQLAHHAGFAHAIVGLLHALPSHATRGQVYVPIDLLERHGAGRADVLGRKATPALRSALAELRDVARRHLAAAKGLVEVMRPELVPALLPIAAVRPMLDRMDRRDHDPFAPPELAPWRRQWLIWRAARNPLRMF